MNTVLRQGWAPAAAIVSAGLLLLCLAPPAAARPAIRASFFRAYPSAVGTRLDNLPSIAGHCGVCHYKFTGGGTRNPFGAAVEAAIPRYPNTDAGRQQAILSVLGIDQDDDAFASVTEITSMSFGNTPTFPGLNTANVSQVTGVNVNDILDYLTPSTGIDAPPPTGTVLIRQALAMRIEMSQAGRVSMQVFDVRDRRVARREFDVGTGATWIAWDGRDDYGHQVQSGVYWAVVRTGNEEWRRQVVR